MYLGKYFFTKEITRIQIRRNAINKIYSAKYPYGKNTLKISKKLSLIAITYTPINHKKLGQVGHLKSLGNKKNLCGNLAISPSPYLSAFGQTLFQRACFTGELCGKGKEFEVNSLELPRTGAQKI